MDENAKEEVVIDATDHTLNIYQRMLKAQSMIGTVAKNIEVETGKQRSYKAVTESDILDAVKIAEKACGIYSFPYAREIYENKETKNSYGTINFWMRFKVTFRFINVDNPDDYIDITSYGDGVDTLDKAPGKGMTYADKYALMKAYKVSTGDDADKEPSTEQVTVEKKEQKSIEQLIVEWSKCRQKLDELKVDYRSDAIADWIKEQSHYDDQNIDMNNVEKVDAICKTYRTLIKSKMEAAEEGSYIKWRDQ